MEKVKNINLSHCSEIKEICTPLYEHLGITYFNYVKLWDNGFRSILTDRSDFIECYYGNKELYQTPAVTYMENSKDPAFHLSNEFQDQLSYVVAREEFDIANGLTIIIPHPGYKELYYFGTKRENNYLTSVYVNNLDLFYHFILYFKDKAKKLIEQADDNKFNIDGLISSNHFVTPPFKTEEIRKLFLEDTPVERLFFNHKNSNTFLSNREIECLYYLLKNFTAKKIAKQLNISSRTVETYINSIKTKLNYSSKKDLISNANRNSLGDIVNKVIFPDPNHEVLKHLVNIDDTNEKAKR